MVRTKLENFIHKRRCTLLGAGPMSLNCVDATIELANEQNVPIMIVASRRQIEAEEFGGGYVNNWSTERFAEYVINNDKQGKIILARDHGGPWQSEYEIRKKFSLRKAMESAKISYQADIEAGLEVIHIDTSVDIFGIPQIDDVLLRLFELIEFCWMVAQRNNRKIIFEIGTEEQTGSTNTVEELEYVLSQTYAFCDKYSLPKPTFVVSQTGTRVMETRNVGSFDSPVRIANELPAEIQVPKMIDVCRKFDIYMKEHNTDYLSDEALLWHPKLGIHSANVAPEFGVTETQAFLALLKNNGLEKLEEEFIELSFNSKKWDKWMLPDTSCGKYEKAIIAGHYVFSDPIFVDIKQRAQTKLKNKNINIDQHLKLIIKEAIFRYLKHFRLLRLS